MCDDLDPGGGLSEALAAQPRAGPRGFLSFHSWQAQQQGKGRTTQAVLEFLSWLSASRVFLQP